MDDHYFEQNLQIIAETDPATADKLRSARKPGYPEIRLSKDRLPVPVVGKKSLHSTYHPRAEAAKWVASLKLRAKDHTLYALCGLGFGYHLSELLKIIPPDRLIIVEEDTALAAAALANRPPEVFPRGLRFITGEKVVTAHQMLRKTASARKSEIRLLLHPASTHRRPDYYLTLEGIFRSEETTRHGGYKILLVSPLYGGSLPLTGYVQRALNALGHRCVVLDNTPFFPGFQHLKTLTSNRGHEARLEGGLNALLAETVTAKALDERADMVLWMAQSPAIPEVIRELQNGGIQTAFWFVEDYLTLNYWQAIAPHLDHFFTIQRGEFTDKLNEIGCENPYYLPVGADPEIHRPLELTSQERKIYGSDLSHVGAGYHNRREFFNGLLDFDFKIWGNEWDNCGPLLRVLQRRGERISTEETVKIFNAAKINVNLHSSTYHSGVNPFGDYLNPRTFEIASCGAFQLVDERAYLTENFTPDEEIVTFASREEFRDKAKFYLEHEDKRRKIAAAGRARTLREHTYQHRMLELMGVICGRRPDWKPKGGDLPTAEELIRQAGEDSELAQVMRRFVGRGPLTLDGIAGEIEREKGELTRTEAMILLLNEFRQWGIEKGVV